MIPKITQAGLDLLADAITSGYPVQLTHIGFGVGTYDPDGSEVAMASEVTRKAIAAGTNFANQVRIYAIWNNNSQQSEVTEVGIYAGTTLFAVWSNAGGYPVAYKTLEVDLVAYYDFIIAETPHYALSVVVDSGESALLSALAVHTTDDDAHPLYKKRITDIFCGVSTGIENHFELTPVEILDQVYSDYMSGDKFSFKAHLSNSGPAFVSVNGLLEIEILLNGASIEEDTIIADNYYELLFNDGDIHIVNSYSKNKVSDKLKNLLFNGDFSKDGDGITGITFSERSYYLSHIYGKRVAKNWYVTSGDSDPHISTYNTNVSISDKSDTALSLCKSDKLLKIENTGGGLDKLYILNKNEEGSLYARGINARISEISGKTLTVSYFAQADRDCLVTIFMVAEYGNNVTGSASVPVTINCGSDYVLSASTDGSYYKSTFTVDDIISGKIFDFTSNSSSFDFLSLADSIQFKAEVTFENGQDTTLYISDFQLEHGDLRTEFENPEKQLQGSILNALSDSLDIKFNSAKIRNLLCVDNDSNIDLGMLLNTLRNGIDEYDLTDLALNKSAVCGRRTVRIYLDDNVEWLLNDSAVEYDRTISNTNIEIFIKSGTSLKLNTFGGYGYSWIFNNSSLRVFGGSGGSLDDLVIDMSLAVNVVPFVEFLGDSSLVVEDSVGIVALAPYARPIAGWGEYTIFKEKYDNSYSWVGGDNLSYDRFQVSYYPNKLKTNEALGSITQDDTINLVYRFGDSNKYHGSPAVQALSSSPFWKYFYYDVEDIRNNKSVEYSGVISGGATFNLCSLAFDPDIVLVWLDCDTADLGYSVGDRIPISGGGFDVSSGCTYAIKYDVYNSLYYLSFKIAVTGIPIVHASTGYCANIDFSKWKIGAKLAHIPNAYIEP